MPAAPPQTAKAPFLKGSILWEKKGPLPVWAWALIGLAVVFMVMWWRRNHAAAESTEATTGYVDELPGDQTAGPIFILPGSPAPAINVPVTVVPHESHTVPTAPPGAGSPPPTTTPPTVPTAPGRYVEVAKFTTKNPPWNSYLYGIWQHLKAQTTAPNWQAIWNHPLNADLRRKRGAADRIQPKDKVFVPGRF